MNIEMNADEIDRQIRSNDSIAKWLSAFVPLFVFAAVVALFFNRWWSLTYLVVACAAYLWTQRERQSSAAVVSISNDGLVLLRGEERIHVRLTAIGSFFAV